MIRGGAAVLPAAMARAAASSAAGMCFSAFRGVSRINRLAAVIYSPRLYNAAISWQRGPPAWSNSSFRLVSTGVMGRKERASRVEENSDEVEEESDYDDDDDDEFDDEEDEVGKQKDSPLDSKQIADSTDDDPGELEIIRRISALDPGPKKKPGPWKSQFPLLTQKEKKELRAHAHRLGKSITLQHVGKFGVTESTLKCFGDALEKNELMKVRILDNCPTHISQVQSELEEGLEAQVVGKVGHVLLLYRPSLQKAKMDEKNAQKKRGQSRQGRI